MNYQALGAAGAGGSVGRFQLLAELGRGGMARVYLAVARGPANFEKLLAVKLLREELAGDPELVSMFLDEARLAARLNHPNIVQTYEAGREGEHCFLVMDYLEGPSLAGLLRQAGRGAMPLDLHVMVLAEVLAGLHYAHGLCARDGTPLGVVHRDVSPKNVIVTFEGQVKLVDFGIAKAADASAQTAQGVFKGTTAYAAPEQARGLPVDARADVFAAGVMLWEALARRPLASRGAELAAFASRVAGAEPRASDVAPDAPPALAAICERAMAFEPSERYPTALALRDELEAWLAARPKRTSARELSTYVSAACADERAALRALVEERFRGATHAGAVNGAPSADVTGATPLTTRAPYISEAREARAPGRRDGRGAAWGAVALAGALACGALALRAARPRRALGVAEPVGAPAAAAAAVDLALRYAPADARRRAPARQPLSRPLSPRRRRAQPRSERARLRHRAAARRLRARPRASDRAAPRSHRRAAGEGGRPAGAAPLARPATLDDRRQEPVP